MRLTTTHLPNNTDLPPTATTTDVVTDDDTTIDKTTCGTETFSKAISRKVQAIRRSLCAVRLVRRPVVIVRLAMAVTVAAIVFTPSSAGADPVHTVALADSVSTVLDNIRNWLMGILAGLATVFLTIGGVRYVMAGGDPGEVQKGKIAFKSAGMGYALAALAPLVVTVLKGIVGA